MKSIHLQRNINELLNRNENLWSSRLIVKFSVIAFIGLLAMSGLKAQTQYYQPYQQAYHYVQSGYNQYQNQVNNAFAQQQANWNNRYNQPRPQYVQGNWGDVYNLVRDPYGTTGGAIIQNHYQRNGYYTPNNPNWSPIPNFIWYPITSARYVY